MQIDSFWRDHYNITGRSTRCIKIGERVVGYIYKDTDRGIAKRYRVEVMNIAEDGWRLGPRITHSVRVFDRLDADRYDLMLAEGTIDPKFTKKTARAAYNECVRWATEHVDALRARWEACDANDC